jgi:hypothetical protein
MVPQRRFERRMHSSPFGAQETVNRIAAARKIADHRSKPRVSMVSSALVVSTETGGLGNRLKSWVSCMRLATDARVHWPVTKNMPAAFDDLFANDCAVATVPAGAQVYGSWRLAILPGDEALLPAGFATVGAGAHPVVRGLGKAWWSLTGKRGDRYRFMVFPKQHSRRSTRADARHIDLEYERIPAHFRALYAELFARITVRPAIAAAAAEWAAANLDDGVIGVQVRTWRDDPRRHRKYHLPSLRRLERLLDAAPGARFLVVSDSDEVVPMLAARYGGHRVLSYPRATSRASSWSAPIGVQEDLIDMLLLSRTERLFASYLSTFSEAAWWLGGTKARVDVF